MDRLELSVAGSMLRDLCGLTRAEVATAATGGISRNGISPPLPVRAGGKAFRSPSGLLVLRVRAFVPRIIPKNSLGKIKKK